ncbi:MAG: type II restriction endonuclease [candidate division WOR-3 bacterium]
MNLDYYQKFWGEGLQENEVIKRFKETLLKTTRSYDSLVNWEKIRQNVHRFKYEIAILNSLKHAKDLEKELYNILSKYPRVVKVIPLIVAVREENFQILDYYELNSGTVVFQYQEIDFSTPLDHEKRLKIVNFCSKTGILALLKEVNDLFDYLVGVEVGLDSNARKNRSGSFMEQIVNKHLIEIKSELSLKLISQKLFSKVAGFPSHPSLANRKFDYLIMKDKLGVNIEVNAYNVPGSKPQEIVDSYIERSIELKKLGLYFVWITDGPAWLSMDNQLKKAFKEIDFILNLHFVSCGFLKFILRRLLS